MPKIDDCLRDYLHKGIESFLSGKMPAARWYFEKVLAQIELLDSGEAARARDLQQVINLFDNANKEAAKARDVAEVAIREAEARWSLQEADQREVASRAARVVRASAAAAEKAVEEMRPRTIAAVSAATRHDRELLIAACQRSYRKAAAAHQTAESAYREVKSARQRAHEVEEERKIAILVNQSFNKGVEAFRRRKYDTAIQCLTGIVDPRARIDAGLEARARCFLKVVILTKTANDADAEVQAVADAAIYHASGPWDPEDSEHREAAEQAVGAARDSARAAHSAAEQTREKAGAVLEGTGSFDDLRVTAVERACRNVTAAIDAAKTARLEVEEARQRASDQAAKRRNSALTAIDKLFKTDFLSADDTFACSPYSRYVTEEDYERRKTQFVQGWAKRALQFELDHEQAVAVSTRGDVLATARAGSGKTRTLVTRAIFLLRHCRVSPRALLLLAFNKEASRQIQERIKRGLRADAELPHVMTFHALAHAIVRPKEHLVFDDRGADSLGRSRETQESIDEFIKQDGRERGVIRDIMLTHFRDDWELLIEGRFHLPMDELLKYRYSLLRETLTGEYVKSYGEKVIANTLFEHGVKYEYERSVRWNGVNYRPDFTILPPVEGAQGSNRIRSVIEYFGLEGEPDYDARSDDKRTFWRRRSVPFLEYTPRDIASQGKDAFVEQLLHDLRRVGIAWRRRSDEDIWREVQERAVDSFSKAMTTFIGRCRKRDLSSARLQDKVTKHEPMNSAEEKFLEAAVPIYSGYLERFQPGGKEDFDGLVWRAIKRAQQGETQFVREGGREHLDLRQLRFVMIDEFQDFSQMFFDLTSAIRSANPDVRFFAVGDDWQAINAFAGSDLKFFMNFKEYFTQETRTLPIRTNYRSDSSIVKVGNSVMRGYGEAAQPDRSETGSAQVGSLDDFRSRAIEEERHKWDDSTPAVLRLVSHFLNTGKPDGRVILLSRTNLVPWTVFCNHKTRHDRTLDGFCGHVRSYLPEGERKRVNAATIHRYKGLEASAVIVLDALEHRYPLIHPHWIFTRVFDDTLGRIVEEERRLLYVAMTRAKNNLVLLTSTECEASTEPSLLGSVLKDDTLTSVSWEELPAGTMLDRGRVEVRVDNRHAIDQTKQKLKDSGYIWKGGSGSGYWCRTFAPDNFSLDRLRRQPWIARGVTIQIHDATDGRPLRRLESAVRELLATTKPTSSG